MRSLRPPRLQTLRGNPAVQDSAVLYASHMVGAGTGFIVALIVARHLGPTEYAVVAAYMLLVDVLTGFTDFGLGTALIRFASPLLQTARERSFPYFRAALYAEIFAGLFVLIAGLSLSGLVKKLIGHDLPHEALTLGVIAAALTSTGAYVAAAQSAHKLFKRSAALAIGVGILRLGTVLALVWTDELSLTSVLWAYAAVSFVAAAAGFAITPRDYLQRVPSGAVKRAANDIMRFTGWLTLTFFLTSVMGRLDFFYLYRIKGADAAGVYAAAIQLSLAVTILIGAVTTVLTPYASERTTYASKVDFLKRSMPIVGGLAALLVLSSVTYPFVIELLFGNKYADAATPLAILIVHLAINIVLIPISLLFVPYGRVRVGTFISVVQLGTVFVLYPVLIRWQGAVGAALTTVVTSTIGLVVYSVILQRLMARDRRGEQVATAPIDQPA